MLQPGARIDRFIVDSLIGHGAMASVYRVHHAELNTLHALKVVEVQGFDVIPRLRREARAQAMLRHPNVAAVTDLLDVNGLPGLLMEYVEGSSLDRRLARAPMPYETVDSIFLDVCAGLEAAHALQMVHRDVKPANVLLAQDADRVVAKVSDFGIVKVLGSSPTLTRSESAMGTPGYMAPEQVFDAKRVDSRADIYSLGATLFRMVCGAPPFHGPVREVLDRIRINQFEAPEAMVPELPERYARTIRACMATHRHERPENVAAVRGLFSGSSAGQVPAATTVAAPTFSRSGPTIAKR